MTDAPAPAAAPSAAPKTPRRLPPGARGWLAGAALAGLLVLLELAWPPHAPFHDLEFFLFHLLYAVAASATAIVVARIAERLLIRDGHRDE